MASFNQYSSWLSPVAIAYIAAGYTSPPKMGLILMLLSDAAATASVMALGPHKPEYRWKSFPHGKSESLTIGGGVQKRDHTTSKQILQCSLYFLNQERITHQDFMEKSCRQSKQQHLHHRAPLEKCTPGFAISLLHRIARETIDSSIQI